MFQTWSDISFIHWRYDSIQLQRRLPASISIEMFDGSAWLGLTPFMLENLRAPALPALPWLSRFPEMNLRTYVHGPAGPGIWFFSLDADRLAAVLGARLTFGLPYHWADMNVKKEQHRLQYYLSRGGRARAHIEIECGGFLQESDPLATFLTARFRLYTVYRGRLASAAVEHKPWPLQMAHPARLEQTVTLASGFDVAGRDPVIHFSSGVDVRIGPLVKC